MGECRDCKHCAREMESWEHPEIWWWECTARTGYDALPSWPFESTKCRKFERAASVAATAAASEGGLAVKLERYNPVSHNPLQYDPEMDECADGEFYRAADVDALIARIRAAVDALDNAWRVLAEGEHLVGVCDNDTADAADRQALDDIESAREALDALLADGGE